MFKQTGTIFIGASLLLAGCGGSGGGNSSENLTYNGTTTAVVISDQNTADSIASSAVSEATSGDLSNAASSLLTGVSATSTESTTQQPGLSILSKTAKKYADIAHNLAQKRTSDSLTGITNSDGGGCANGGSWSYTETYSDYSQVSVGDTMTITYQNCNDGYSIANGSMSLAVQSYDIATGDVTLSLSIGNLKIIDTSSGDYNWLNGGYTAAITGDGYSTDLQISITGSSLVMQQSINGSVEGALLTNFSFVDTMTTTGDYTYDHDFTIASTKIGGAVTVTTVTPFTIYSGDLYPTVGQVIVTGANNSSVKVTAESNTTVTIEYDLEPADGIYGNGSDPAAKTVAWTDL